MNRLAPARAWPWFAFVAGVLLLSARAEGASIVKVAYFVDGVKVGGGVYTGADGGRTTTSSVVHAGHANRCPALISMRS